MFASDTLFDEQSGLLRNGKRYKRNFDPSSLSQVITSTPVNPEESDSEDDPSVGNPPVTPQRRSTTPESPSPSEGQPSPSIPTTSQSTLVNPPHQRPVPLPTSPETPWPTSLMTLNSPSLKVRDQRTHSSSGFSAK